LKVTVVLYDDGDSQNKNGPLHADIFRICWEKAGKPKDFWQVKGESVGASKNFEATIHLSKPLRNDKINRHILSYQLSDLGENRNQGIKPTAGNTEICSETVTSLSEGTNG
jgi:hypothetical protein